MIPQRIRVFAVCAAAVAVCLWAFASPALGADSGDVKLTTETLGDPIGAITPGKVQRRFPVALCNGPAGQVMIGGKSISTAATPNGFFGVDVNVDGKVDPQEMGKPAGGVMGVSIKGLRADPKKDTLVVFSGVEILTANGKVTSASGQFFAGSVQKGAISGTTVRIVDDDLDGKITQDGKDAIFIGNNPCAQPLVKVHQIGNAFFELKVAEDGATVSYSKVTDLKMGQADATLLKSPAVQSIILVDEKEGRAVDLISAKTALPAGDYKLLYGVIRSGKDTVIFTPTDKTPTYTTQADGVNTLALGTPLRLDFRAAQNGNDINVFPNIHILGAGNEDYRVDFHGAARPGVVLMEGSRTLSQEPMGFG